MVSNNPFSLGDLNYNVIRSKGSSVALLPIIVYEWIIFHWFTYMWPYYLIYIYISGIYTLKLLSSFFLFYVYFITVWIRYLITLSKTEKFNKLCVSCWLSPGKISSCTIFYDFTDSLCVVVEKEIKLITNSVKCCTKNVILQFCLPMTSYNSEPQKDVSISGLWKRTIYFCFLI